MLNESEVQTLDTTATELVAPDSIAPLAPLPIPAEQLADLLFPCTLKDVAESLGINYDTLRNKWIGRIDAIYDGLDCPQLRDKTRKVTEFGFQAIKSFVKEVVQDGVDIEIYRAVTRSEFADKPSSSPVNGSMVPYQPSKEEEDRFTPPERKVFQFTSTEEFVSTAKQNTETALDTTQQNSSSLTEALINQMQQEGQKLGLTLFQAKYGTAHAVLADLEDALAKKSGLVSDSASPPSGSAA